MLTKRKKMEMNREFKISLWIINFVIFSAQFGYIKTQDHQNYFFPQNNQGRFVPSTHFQRPSFFSSSGTGFHQIGQRNVSPTNQNNVPGSYQEQIIFVGNEGTTPQDANSQFQFQQFPSTRSPVYYDLSPRPFGLPQGTAPGASAPAQQQPVGPQFTRNQSVRPNGSIGFIPQKLANPGRPNVPHQQSQFLAHFNEQSQVNNFGPSTQEKPSTTTQSNRLTRPFGGTNFSRNRPAGTSFLRPQQVQNNNDDILANQQQQLPYRNSRNRFQPNSERTTTTATTTTTTSAPTEKPRYNRYGNAKIPKQQQLIPSRSPVSFSPSKSRTTAAPISKTTSKPKRPVFISREVNEPVHLKPRIQFNKISINHNGSDKNGKKLKIGSESLDEIPTNVDQLDEEIREDNQVSNDEKPVTEVKEENLEKLQLQEAITKTNSTETNATLEEHPAKEILDLQSQKQQLESQDETEQEITDNKEISENPDLKNTVIITSNFFMPGQSAESQEIEGSQEIEKSSKENQDKHESESDDTYKDFATTTKTTDYEYEYEDYEEKPASTDPTVENKKKESLSVVSSTTEREFIQATTFRRNFDKVTESQVISKISERPDIDSGVLEVSETSKPVYETPNEQSIEVHETPEEDAKIPQNETILESEKIQQVPETTEMNAEEEDITTVPTVSDNEGHSSDGSDSDSDSGEYDEEYDDLNSSKEASGDYPEDVDEETAQQKPDDFLEHQVVSVVTTKSVINGSTSYPAEVTSSTSAQSLLEDSRNNNETIVQDYENLEIKVNKNQTNIEETSPILDENVNNATEGYVVIASIQTSRSINGARFLPFPAIEQEETKQTLSELERKIHEQKNSRTTKKAPTSDQTSEGIEKISTKDSDSDTTTEPIISITVTTPEELEDEKSVATDKPQPSQSTESIYDKLDRVQSDLSSGLLTGKFPILNEMPDLDTSTQASSTATSGTKFIPKFTKFMPKTTHKPKVNFDDIQMDDLAGLVPPGFKVRTNNFRNRKITTTTTSTTTEVPTLSESAPNKPSRNFSIGRSFKNNPNTQDLSLAGLLPKGYKVNDTKTTTTEPPPKSLTDILSKIKFEESVEDLIPKDYKEKISKTSTNKPFVTVVEDNSKFLPPGFNKFKIPPTTTTSTTRKPPATKIKDGITNLLPPGFKLPANEEETTSKKKLVPVVKDEISKFLPPGFKLEKEEDSGPIDISKLLPKGKIIEVQNIPGLLPPGFKSEEKKQIEIMTTTTAKPSDSGGFKVVFPKSLNKRPRLTTPRPHSSQDGPAPPQITIKKGPPTRATTEFTGWPTPSTTPISIEKLLEQSRTANILEDYFPSSTTSTTTTTTTTTTPEPPRPTEPGHCRSECNLAGTIKIVDGVKWRPELLDHNTLEWKNLAKEVEAQLNDVYSSAPYLNNWYKKVRIDSFNKGSVLVDYFVELQNITRDVNTIEIKRLFHDALMQTPLTVIPLKKGHESDDSDEYREGKGEKLVKETYLLGRFIVDPMSTDFIVIPKSYQPTVEYADDDVIFPQWAIVLIVIGVGSLCFIVIFGVTVLLSRHKNSKKTPTPLTADMLNELNKDHMGGVDNYGADDFYNVDDAWNDTKQPIKPKRFTNSMHGSSASNIYDSWRSTRHGDYYYDQHNYTPHHHKVMEHQYQPEIFDAHQLYTYNPRTRYHRDPYDPDF